MTSRFLTCLVLCEVTVAFIAGCGGSGKRAIEAVDAAGAIDTPASTGGAAGAGGIAVDGGLSDVIGTFSTGGSTGTAGAATGGGTTGIGGLLTGGNVPMGGYATGGGGTTGGLGTTGGVTVTGGNAAAGTTGTGGGSRSGGAIQSSTAGGASATGGKTITGGTTGTGGASRTGGAGAGGSSAMGGTTGTGSSGTGACGGVTVSGKFSFDEHSDVTFDTVVPTLHHKRDVDRNEDGCLNSIVLNFSLGGACKMEVRVESASTCVVSSPQGMRISSIRFEADSQCPGFPDAEEGIYTATAANLNGATIFWSAWNILEPNVASACVSETFNITLAGGLRNTTTGGVLHFSRAGISQLTVTGKSLTTEGPGACPTTRCPGCGDSLNEPCRPGEFCTSMGMCAGPGTWTSCTDFSQCAGRSDCLSTPAGFRCREACTSNAECYVASSTALGVCFAASNGDKTCQLDCSAGGSRCPSSTVCKSFATGKFCSSDP